MERDLSWLIDFARREGADETELYHEDWHETRIVLSHGQVQSASTSDLSGLGIRVYRDGRLGFAHTNSRNRAALEDAVRMAIDASGAGKSDEHAGLPDPRPVSPLDAWHQSVVDVPMAEKISRLESLQEVALSVDPRSRGLSDFLYSDRAANVRVINSRGVDVRRRATTANASVEAVAEHDGETQSTYRIASGRSLESLDLLPMIQASVKEAAGLLGARQIESREAPVVLSPMAAAQFVMMFGYAVSADAVQRGRSMFQGKVGQQIANERLRMVDDPWLSDGDVTGEFDGEGVPTAPRDVISGGVLQTLLYDTVTARREGRESTGHGNRLVYRSVPLAFPSNMYIPAGESSSDEVIAQAGDGLYVAQLFGLQSGGADPVSGNLSVGVNGFAIENGELSFPVREATIAGTLFDLLRGVVATGNDLMLVAFRGCWGAPTVLVERLSISGQ